MHKRHRTTSHHNAVTPLSRRLPLWDSVFWYSKSLTEFQICYLFELLCCSHGFIQNTPKIVYIHVRSKLQRNSNKKRKKYWIWNMKRDAWCCWRSDQIVHPAFARMGAKWRWGLGSEKITMQQHETMNPDLHDFRWITLRSFSFFFSSECCAIMLCACASALLVSAPRFVPRFLCLAAIVVLVFAKNND